MAGSDGRPGARRRDLVAQVERLLVGAREHTGAVPVGAGADAGISPEMLGGYLAAALDTAPGRRLGETDLAEYRHIGIAAAEQGVSLSALLDLYLSATWRLWEEVASAADRSTTDALIAAATALFRASDDAVAVLTQGYEAAQQRTVRREESVRREFVDDLLSGTPAQTLLTDRAARFGFNLAGIHMVAVAQTRRALVDAGPVQARVETHILASFGGRDIIVATKEGALVCVLPAATPGPVAPSDPVVGLLRTLEETGEGPWQLGIGRPYPGTGGILRSFDEARDALRLAELQGIAAPVVRFETLLPYRLLSLDPTASGEMVESVLGPLQEARGGMEPLVETLAAYFAEAGNVSATARRLHLSARAVTYRLDKIRRLTGYAPQEAEDRFVLELAVRCRRTLPPPP